MANGYSTADRAVRVQGRSGEDSPIHLADRTDGVNCEREKKKVSFQAFGDRRRETQQPAESEWWQHGLLHGSED